MPNIRKIQSRDVPFLAERFTHRSYDDFDKLYIDHLQDTSQTFVISTKDDDGERQYFGYISLVWQSEETILWRRNIPQIIDLTVLDSVSRKLTMTLIARCEDAARAKGITKIGVCLMNDTFEETLFEASGYTAANLGKSTENAVCLIKNLSSN